MCEHKFISLYCRQKFQKNFPEWLKVPFKICLKCNSVYTFKQVIQLKTEQLPEEISEVLNERSA